MNVQKPAKIRELTQAELDKVSGGTRTSSSVINTSALTLPKPPYPAV